MFECNCCERRRSLSPGTGYPPCMASAAGDVAAALRERLPGLPLKKLHKLLYYCQAHHLVATGEPLFLDTISAWDMGPVVGALWYRERSAGLTRPTRALEEAQLNTIGYVASRYGRLSGRDLEHLTHAEAPWQQADQNRQPHGSVRIELDTIRDYFQLEAADPDDDELNLEPATVAHWLAGASHRRSDALAPDTYEDLRRRAHAS